MTPSIQYASLLIRLWREGNPERASTSINWHSEVEHLQTGDCWSFQTLDELLGFLREEVGRTLTVSDIVNEM
jgi:hypothetical protein